MKSRMAVPGDMLFLTMAAVGVCAFPVGAGEVYTSVAKLKLLPKIEKKLIDACDRYITSRPDDPGLANIKRFLFSTRPQNQLACDDPAHLENPVNGFRFLWRLVDGWQRATRVRCAGDCDIRDSSRSFLQQIRSSIDSVSSWPSHEDVTGSAVALTKLLHTYDLDPDDVAKGRLLHTQTMPLDPDELFVLGEEVHYHHTPQDARMWLNISITRLEEMRDQERLLRDAHHRLREVEKKIQAKGSKGQVVSEAPDVLFTVGYEELEDGDEGGHLPVLPSNKTARPIRGFYQSAYEDLCRQDRKSPKEVSDLVCWYQHTLIPYMKVKVEQLHLDPAILMYHDVISDSEIADVKNISMRLLTRSLLGKPDGSGHEGMNERISQSAWVFDDLEVTSRLSRRIQLFTGLSTKLQKEYSHAEAFQVVNYGLGGLYEPHEDSVRMYRKLGYEKSPSVRHSGDRLATWLFYMSDVPAGGATVFPLIKTRVPVTKGAAAFWYNLHRNGKPDLRTIHAGCPVLIGDKWIANKWIREVGQTFRRPCSLDPHE
ncbi:prolyl 4-hydroxylase subunit alpha-1-like [Haliotis asinina]|uniref:prolyl 4-hydroxylase subunit alpha-1-like n=1 Tax=Haliotis asinina TaxID=109174 RepID=UPI0035324F10